MDSLIRIEGKAAEALVNKIGEAITGFAKPWQIRRVTKAQAEAFLIKKQTELEAMGMEHTYKKRFIAEELKKQVNMDHIIENAIPLLSSDARPEDIENDWLSYFFDRCRIISDENVQQVWSKILAGEANVPGSFSRKTIDCLQALDREDAKIFNALRSYMIRIKEKLVVCVFDPTNDLYESIGKGYGKLQQLESLGLLTVVFSSIFGGPCIERLENEITMINYFNQKIKIIKQKDNDSGLRVGYVRLTRTGRELAEICHGEPISAFIKFAVDHWKSSNAVEVKME